MPAAAPRRVTIQAAEPEPDRVQSILNNLPGIRNVALHDAEGMGTLGFRVRTSANQDPREAIFAAAVHNDFVLLDLHRERVSLEDTFRRLTKGQGGANV